MGEGQANNGKEVHYACLELSEKKNTQKMHVRSPLEPKTRKMGNGKKEKVEGVT